MTESWMSWAAFDALAGRVCNWGRWGDADERGTLNFLTPERRRAAAALIQDGATVSCAQDLATQPRADNPRPSLHRPFWMREAEQQVASEVLTIEPHGFAITHLDALNHVAYRGRMYNDRPMGAFLTDDRSQNTILTAMDGIQGRGVLIDLADALGKPWMEPGEAAGLEVVKRALDLQHVEVLPGDILFFRTGRLGRDAVHGVPPFSAGLAGVGIDCAEWVHERQVASLVCDAGMDPQPSEVEGVRIPWHVLTLVQMGMMITDNADLEALAAACRERRRWSFFATLAPLRVPAGNSSPINPIATF